MGRNNDAAALEERQRQEWQLGKDWARWLVAGNEPQALTLYGLVLEQGETAYLQGNLTYARLYGGTGRYNQSGGVFFGSPGMVLGLMAANAAVNASRKAAARRDMQLLWRDVQEVPVIGTDRRLMCHLPGRGWLSFYFSTVTEFYPDPVNWTITFGFQESEPLRLSGLAAPTFSVFTSWCVLGAGRWQNEPGIAPLVQSAGSPQVQPEAGDGARPRLPRIPGQ